MNDGISLKITFNIDIFEHVIEPDQAHCKKKNKRPFFMLQYFCAVNLAFFMKLTQKP